MKPRILHLVSNLSAAGGSRAVVRLHAALRSAGLDSRILSLHGQSPDLDTIQVAHQSPWRKLAYKASLAANRLRVSAAYPYTDRRRFLTGQVDAGLLDHPWLAQADLVVLHDVFWHLLSLESLERLAGRHRLAWFLHDLWPVTGGCTYPNGCERFAIGCGQCPALKSNDPGDLSARLLQAKQRLHAGANPIFIASSDWLAGAVERSAATPPPPRIARIPIPLDPQEFFPEGRQQARQALGIAEDAQVLLCGSTSLADPRKGFHLLARALELLAEHHPSLAGRLQLVAFGSAPAMPPPLPIPCRFLGTLATAKDLRLAYSAADLFAGPSLEEAFGLVFAESLACATPAIAFADTGAASILQHRQSGWLAARGDANDLATGIAWCLENNPDNRLGDAGLAFVRQQFAPAAVARQFLALLDA